MRAGICELKARPHKAWGFQPQVRNGKGLAFCRNARDCRVEGARVPTERFPHRIQFPRTKVTRLCALLPSAQNPKKEEGQYNSGREGLSSGSGLGHRIWHSATRRRKIEVMEIFQVHGLGGWDISCHDSVPTVFPHPSIRGVLLC